KIGMLGNPGDLGAPLLDQNLVERDIIHADRSAVSLDKAQEQLSDGTLSRSTRPNERDLLTLHDVKGNIMQGRTLSVIGVVYVREANAARSRYAPINFRFVLLLV